jgi:hypothetical protein
MVMIKEKIEEGIYIYKNVLFNAKEIISELEECVKSGIVNWTPSTVQTGDVNSTNKLIRDTDVIGVPYLGKIDEDFTNISEEIYKSLNNYFYEAFTPCEKDYYSMFGIETNWHDSWGILKYGEGQFFTNHIDDNINYHRRVSTIFYMNDNYKGGEINFPRYNLSIKPKAGDFLIFPAFYTYNHSVNTVTKGTRYSVVSWAR